VEQLREFGLECGIVVSGATTTYAPIQVYRRAEKLVAEEQLAIVHDEQSDVYFLGVIRRVTKYEPLVRDRVRTPYVDRPDILDNSLLMPYMVGTVVLYGEIDRRVSAVKEVVHVPTPGSRVYLLQRGEILSEYVKLKSWISIGRHKYSGWAIPLDPRYISYHVGVFGATGVGKSRLVRALVCELAKLGYPVVVFDHTGIDYAPYFNEVVHSSRISIPPHIIASVLAKKANLSWQSFGEYLEIASITYAMQKAQRDPQTGKPIGWSKEGFLAHLRGQMRKLGSKESSVEKVELFIRYFVDDEFFSMLDRRTTSPGDVVDMAVKNGLVVIDLSHDTDLPVKQAIVATIVEEAWRRVRLSKEPYPMVFVIDEAQNYAPTGWAISKDPIETTAREGRKWGLSLVLASQRVAGDLDPSIRANLGTVFFSRLTAPTDLREVSMYMDLADVSESTLAQLAPREFFVAGLMNPLRKPILIRVRDVE